MARPGLAQDVQHAQRLLPVPGQIGLDDGFETRERHLLERGGVEQRHQRRGETAGRRGIAARRRMRAQHLRQRREAALRSDGGREARAEVLVEKQFVVVDVADRLHARQ
ncbi:MAG: hypothetical protein ACKOUS_14290 [Alphaproteobacteria bacterium]